MKTRVYQIISELDVNRVKFWGLDTMRKHYGGTIPAELYHCVYDGDLKTQDLEQIFMILNTSCPPGYNGHSLSMTDVVELEDSNGKCSFFFCDTFGFQPVVFAKDRIRTV